MDKFIRIFSEHPFRPFSFRPRLVNRPVQPGWSRLSRVPAPAWRSVKPQRPELPQDENHAW